MDRQKKLLIFGAAWVSAALLTWFLYAKAVAPQQEKQVRAGRGDARYAGRHAAAARAISSW